MLASRNSTAANFPQTCTSKPFSLLTLWAYWICVFSIIQLTSDSIVCRTRLTAVESRSAAASSNYCPAFFFTGVMTVAFWLVCSTSFMGWPHRSYRHISYNCSVVPARDELHSDYYLLPQKAS